ncbi:hypothetical protein V6N13_111971 [Hibiscus sabdariffa]
MVSDSVGFLQQVTGERQASAGHGRGSGLPAAVTGSGHGRGAGAPCSSHGRRVRGGGVKGHTSAGFFRLK